MNLPAWEACFPYSVDALDKGPLVILNYHICFFFFFFYLGHPKPPSSPPHTHTELLLGGRAGGREKWKGLGHQL